MLVSNKLRMKPVGGRGEQCVVPDDQSCTVPQVWRAWSWSCQKIGPARIEGFASWSSTTTHVHRRPKLRYRHLTSSAQPLSSSRTCKSTLQPIPEGRSSQVLVTAKRLCLTIVITNSITIDMRHFDNTPIGTFVTRSQAGQQAADDHFC